MSKLALARALRRRAGRLGRGRCPPQRRWPPDRWTPRSWPGGLDDPELGPLIEALPVPLGRRATPQEIAAAVAFLLDPAHGYVHGVVLFVDGGTDALLRPDAV